jgi:hypothetical protein
MGRRFWNMSKRLREAFSRNPRPAPTCRVLPRGSENRAAIPSANLLHYSWLRIIKPSSGARISSMNHTKKMSCASSTLRKVEFEAPDRGEAFRVHLHRRASKSKGVNSGSATNGGFLKRSRNTLNGQAKGPCILGSLITRMNFDYAISGEVSP